MRGVILSDIIQFVLELAILSCTFAALLKYLPDGPIPWGDAPVGGTLTHAGTASAIGTAGSLAVLLMWLYVAAVVPLIQIRPSAV